MDIYKTSVEQEYYTQEGCHIIEILNSPDHPTSSIARARVEIGVTTALHVLAGTEEIYYIQSGEGLATIGGQEKLLGVGDCIIIPPDMPQQIRNVGQEDLIFLCVCEPRFEVENYKIVSE